MNQVGDLTHKKLLEVLDFISLPKGWCLRVMRKGDGFLVQIIFKTEDSISGDIETQYCRKWYVSSHSTATEVIRTVYKAGMAALEHEFQEQFKVDGVAIFHPHRDLLDFDMGSLDVRK